MIITQDTGTVTTPERCPTKSSVLMKESQNFWSSASVSAVSLGVHTEEASDMLDVLTIESRRSDPMELLGDVLADLNL